jgi:hypothetical protein
MARQSERERGVAMVLAAIFLVAIVAISAIAIEVGRLTDTATEVQIAADSAALAGAQNLVNGGDIAAASAAGQTVASRNQTDGRAPAPEDVDIDFGSYSAATGYTSGGAPVAGVSVPAVRATVHIPNVQYIFASVLGGSSTTVTKRAVAIYACTGQAQPTAPITIGLCQLQQYTQGHACSVSGSTLAQQPNPTQNSCWTANTSNAPGWLPSECDGGGAPLLSVGDILAGNGLSNGQMVPILRAINNCVSQGVHNYVIPIINCPIANCNNGTSLGEIVAFATIHIAGPSAVVVNGPNAGITFTQICDNNGSGTPGSSAAVCVGRGNVKLVDDRAGT